MQVIISTQHINDLKPEARKHLDLIVLVGKHAQRMPIEIHSSTSMAMPIDRFLELFGHATAHNRASFGWMFATTKCEKTSMRSISTQILPGKAGRHKPIDFSWRLFRNLAIHASEIFIDDKDKSDSERRAQAGEGNAYCFKDPELTGSSNARGSCPHGKKKERRVRVSESK